MAYDKTKNPAMTVSDPNTFSARCDTITPGAGDQTDGAGRYYKYFTAGTAGDVTFVAYADADGATRTMTVAAGQVLPGRIRRVTVSTATLLGWFDA